MNKKLAEALHLHGDMEIDHDYCGRGMSKPTTALVGTDGELLESIGNLFESMMDEALAAGTNEAEIERLRQEVEDLGIPNLGGIRVDNLGMQYVYY